MYGNLVYSDFWCDCLSEVVEKGLVNNFVHVVNAVATEPRDSTVKEGELFNRITRVFVARNNLHA